MFRILSLDGGGIRGAFTASFLARLEQELRAPITNYFDLITGTSTGGIIALGLGLGKPAWQIQEFYNTWGPQIFVRRRAAGISWWRRSCLRLVKRKFQDLDEGSLYRSKYDSKALRETLSKVYGSSTLGDAKASRLVIPAVDLTAGRTITFKTPHQPDFIRDRHLRVVDIALATSAAPTFFPHAVMDHGSAYSDGGLWANNPCIVGYVEAMRIRQVCSRPELDPKFELEDIHMLSVGTGEPQYYAHPGPTDDGLIWWGSRLFDVAGGAQSQGTHFQARYLMGENRYRRVDFKMPSEPWRLDEVMALPQLQHLGNQAAVDCYSALKKTLFASVKPTYYPFQ